MRRRPASSTSLASGIGSGQQRRLGVRPGRRRRRGSRARSATGRRTRRSRTTRYSGSRSPAPTMRSTGPRPLARRGGVERRVRLVGDGEDADRPAVAVDERCRIGPADPQAVRHGALVVVGPSRSLPRDLVAGVSMLDGPRLPAASRPGAARPRRRGCWRRASPVRAGSRPGRTSCVTSASIVDRAGPARGRHAVVPVGDVVVVADLDELDRRKRLQPVHRAVDPLPARAPVPAPQPGKRPEVGGVLGRVAHGADDAVDRDGPAARAVGAAPRSPPDGRRRARAGARSPLDGGRRRPVRAGSRRSRRGRRRATRRRSRRRPERGASEAWRSGGTSSSKGSAPDRAVALRTMMPSPSTGRHGPPGLSCDYSRS